MNFKAWCTAGVIAACGAAAGPAVAGDDCNDRSFQPYRGRINDLGGRRLTFPNPNRVRVATTRSCDPVPIVRRPVRAPVCEPRWTTRCDPWPRYRDCSPSSGIVIRGGSCDDNFSIGFRIGASIPPYSPCVASTCRDDCGPGYGYGYGSVGYVPWSDYTYSAYRENYSAVIGYESAIDQNLAPASAPSVAIAPEPTPTTSIGWARWHLQRAESSESVRAFEAHLVDFPSDTDAMRELGAALILDGRTREGVAMIGHAYQTDPTLGYRPIASVDELGGEQAAKKIMRRAVPFAHEEKSGFAWLTVASLMQAQDRPPALIREMLSRARASGLSADIADILDKSI